MVGFGAFSGEAPERAGQKIATPKVNKVFLPAIMSQFLPSWLSSIQFLDVCLRIDPFQTPLVHNWVQTDPDTRMVMVLPPLPQIRFLR